MVDWEFFGIVATLTGATVVLALTWAVTQRIMADTKKRMLGTQKPPTPAVPSDEVLAALRGMDQRLAGLEDRLDFTERLLEGPKGDGRAGLGTSDLSEALEPHDLAGT